MPGSSSNASFIPKRGTTTRHNKSRGGRIYLLTIVSYVLIIAVLIASAAIFFYERHVTLQLQEEISTMNSEVNDFKQADLEQIQEFDQRLKRAKKRLDHTVSLTSIFEALEASTIKTVQLRSLSLERDADERIVLEAEVETDNFDSSLFQRGIFERNNLIKEVELKDVSIGEVGSEDDEEGASGKTVSFTAYLTVPVEDIPYVPREEGSEPAVVEVITETVAEDVATTTEVVNQEESL